METDQFPSLSVSLSVKVIWEDGFAKEYSDRSSFKLRAGDNFSGGSAPSIWFDNQLNYYSLDSTIKMGANMNRIAQIWGGHYDLDLQGYDRSWQESHGNVVRIDCNGKTILDIDPQKRLYFANEIPVLASGNVLPINQSFKLGNCTLNVKSMDIRDMTYDESAGWHEKITKPNCGVLCMSVKPDVDTFNHYTYEVYDTYHRYGKKIATDYKFSNREGFYAGVQKEYSVQSTVVPIIDCDKISVTITDDETNQSKTLTIPLSK